MAPTCSTRSCMSEKHKDRANPVPSGAIQRCDTAQYLGRHLDVGHWHTVSLACLQRKQGNASSGTVLDGCWRVQSVESQDAFLVADLQHTTRRDGLVD